MNPRLETQNQNPKFEFDQMKLTLSNQSCSLPKYEIKNRAFQQKKKKKVMSLLIHIKAPEWVILASYIIYRVANIQGMCFEEFYLFCSCWKINFFRLVLLWKKPFNFKNFLSLICCSLFVIELLHEILGPWLSAFKIEIPLLVGQRGPATQLHGK